MRQLVMPDAFSAEELAGGDRLRARASYVPKELDSPFLFARQWRAANGDEEIALKRYEQFITHRKAIGYDVLPLDTIIPGVPLVRKTFERFAVSRMDVTSGDVCVFVQKMADVDLKEILKVFPLSYILHSYFCLQEIFARNMAIQERRTGRPSAFVGIMDLEGLHLGDFINPLSAPTKLARLAVKIWADFFSENLVKLIIVKPPALLSLVWQVCKLIMDARTLARITIISDLDDLRLHLDEKAIPVEYGGKRRDDTGFADPPESCCNQPLLVTPEDHWDSDALWRENRTTAPATKSVLVKGKGKHEITKNVNIGDKVLWSFTVNGDMDFEIIDADEQALWPKITLAIGKVPEQGEVEVKRGGEVRIRFLNPSNSFLPTKLTYSIAVV